MPYENVTVDIGDDHVAVLSLNRPQQLNTFNTPLATELEAALKELDADAHVRVVILKGAGKVFCAGIDLNEFFGKTARQYRDWIELMEKPLALLRDDLASLGFERHPDIHEPEDHVAALCEVMAMMIDENRDFATQTAFFTAHIAPWFGQFFNDLSTAKNAVFYRAVGRFGNAFFELEREYLSMTV